MQYSRTNLSCEMLDALHGTDMTELRKICIDGLCLLGFEATPSSQSYINMFPSLILWTAIILSKSTSFQAVGLVQGSSSYSKHVIQICENKNCVKQFSLSNGVDGLTQVFSDLIYPNATNISLQRSGCLSQCGKGPNICIQSDHESRIFFGVKDAYIACSLLKEICALEVSPILLAALDAMNQAGRVSSVEKKIQLLSSVIQQLSSSRSLDNSMILLHARLMRANLYMDQIPSNIPLALMDAQECVSQITSMESSYSSSDRKHMLDSSSTLLFGKAYRTLTDVQEAAGNYAEAMNSIREYVRWNPSGKSKAEKDLLRLETLHSSKL